MQDLLGTRITLSFAFAGAGRATRKGSNSKGESKPLVRIAAESLLRQSGRASGPMSESYSGVAARAECTQESRVGGPEPVALRNILLVSQFTSICLY